MKRKNGFTLIELLVTIALALSVMGLAVLSTIAISNRRKKQAYEEVKQQVMTAAKQYFDSNAYLFDRDEVDGGVITVAMLVNGDYLNKVTNPITGKPLNVCDKVRVTKLNGIYKSDYIEYDSEDNDGICDNVIEIISNDDVETPTITLKYYKVGDTKHTAIKASTTSYFNKSDLGSSTLGVYVTHTGASLYTCVSEDKSKCNNYSSQPVSIKTNYEDETTYYKDTTPKTVCYKSVNGDVFTEKCVTIGVDKTEPTFNTKMYVKNSCDDITNHSGLSIYSTSLPKYKNGWAKTCVFTNVEDLHDNLTANPTVTFTTTGATSNVANKKQNYRNIDAAGTSYVTYTACDVAKNCTTGTKQTIKIDKTNPKCGTFSYSGTEGENSWYRSDRVNITTTTPTDETSKVDTWYWYNTNSSGEYVYGGSNYDKQTSYYLSETGTNRKAKYIVYDKAGRETTCITKAINIDRTAPKVKVSIYHRKNTTDTSGVNGYNNYSKKVDERTVQGTTSDSSNCTNRSMCGYGWFNGNSNPPRGTYNQYGFSIYIEDLQSDVSKVISHWNESGQTDVDDNAKYGWDTTNKKYKNCSSTCTYTLNKSTRFYNNTWFSNISAQGKRRMKFYIYDKAENLTLVSVALNIDRSAPEVNITDGPKLSTCGGVTSIDTKYKVQDNLSGLSGVWDFYGYDDSLASDLPWVKREVTSGTTSSVSFEDNWSSQCKSSNSGTPGSNTCYVLKYWLEDVAGNIKTGMTPKKDCKSGVK